MEEPIIELSEKDTLEFGIVKDNMDKCIRAAELMEYFHKEGLYHTAVRNASHLLSTVRSVVPQNLTENFSMPCWRAHLEVDLVSKDVAGSMGKPLHLPHTAGTCLLREQYSRAIIRICHLSLCVSQTYSLQAFRNVVLHTCTVY